MREKYVLIVLFFCMAASVYAQESIFDFDSKIEIKKHEKLNESPYAIFGDNNANAETLHGNYFGTSYTGPYNPQTYGNEALNIKPKDSYQYIPRNLSD